MTEKLKACPFCGANAWEDKVAYGHFINVCCSNDECDLSTIPMLDSTWNTRPSEAAEDDKFYNGTIEDGLQIIESALDQLFKQGVQSNYGITAAAIKQIRICSSSQSSPQVTNVNMNKYYPSGYEEAMKYKEAYQAGMDAGIKMSKETEIQVTDEVSEAIEYLRAAIDDCDAYGTRTKEPMSIKTRIKIETLITHAIKGENK